MLRADIMDRLSRTLQYNLNNDKPFGGVKVIGIGDLAQICPVVTQEEREVFDSFYASPWWFDARVMQTCDISFRQLTQVFRQTDPGFLELLRRAREGNVPQPWIDRLNKLCHTGFTVPDDVLVLTSMKKAADSLNLTKLAQIEAPAQVYKALKTGSYEKERESSLPVPEVLELKVGAKVVVCKNTESALNGTRGTVEKLDKMSVQIRTTNGKLIEVGREAWSKNKYVIGSKGVEKTPVGVYLQIPLRLGWAVTIHKSQGMTLDRVCIDLGGGAFASGQAYVALSRVRSLSGLILRRELRKSDFFCDPNVNQFLAKLELANSNGQGTLYGIEVEDEDMSLVQAAA